MMAHVYCPRREQKEATRLRVAMRVCAGGAVAARRGQSQLNTRSVDSAAPICIVLAATYGSSAPAREGSILEVARPEAY